MTGIPKVRPAYVSPLTDEQHAQLGRICVLWGQIDLLLDMILKWAYDFSKPQWDALELADRPFGAKIVFLKKSFDTIGDLTILEILKKLHTALNDVKTHRNHAIHGMWGWRVDEKKKTIEPCARYQRTPGTPLIPGDFERLEQRFCYCSNLAANAFLYSRNQSPPDPLISSRFFHGSANHYPELLIEWAEANPEGDHLLDESFREGQLPRAKHPLPTRVSRRPGSPTAKAK